MRPLKRGLALAVCCISWAAWGATAAIDPDLYLGDVKYLASKEMRGRATGSRELETAAAFIAARFHEFGLQPAGGEGFYQAFPVTVNAHLGKSNRFHFTENGKTVTLHAATDFIPFNFSSSGKLAGPVVFAGYGITAPEYNYDDYAGLDVKGKVVLVLRHEPQEFDEHSIFEGLTYTQHAQFATKAANARMHGAAGVILIADRANHPTEGDELERFGSTVGPADAGIPFVGVKSGKLEHWFADAGQNLDNIEAAIDKDLKPHSFAFPDSIQVDANLDVERAVKTVHNVAGYLPGETSEYVILGAHYDHLGLGERFSMAPALVGTAHPGADDNASGTAGVIELARWFAAQPRQKRGILFLAFAGEELGLLGSAFYVSHPLLPLDRAAVMINMDMIGRVRDNKVYVGGTSTGSGLRAMIDRLAPRYGLRADYSDMSGYGSSDHVSFTARQVPILFFFSGLHADYHTPGDTWDKIDAPDAARLLRLVAEAAEELREAAGRPAFLRASAVRKDHTLYWSSIWYIEASWKPHAR